MDSRIISIEHDQLDAACTEISEHVRQIDAELDRLEAAADALSWHCLLYTSPSPRDS